KLRRRLYRQSPGIRAAAGRRRRLREDVRRASGVRRGRQYSLTLPRRSRATAGGAFVSESVTMLDQTTTNSAPAPFDALQRRFYGAIAADPASPFRSFTAVQSQNWNSRRDNERHYSVMKFEALAALPVRELAAPTGCHLFLWTSGPFLPQAMRLIEAWGFTYSTR